jgi:hypothetical protein
MASSSPGTGFIRKAGLQGQALAAFGEKSRLSVKGLGRRPEMHGEIAAQAVPGHF